MMTEWATKAFPNIIMMVNLNIMSAKQGMTVDDFP
jgi:hypothetical protein